jgi:hypothetical protein
MSAPPQEFEFAAAAAGRDHASSDAAACDETSLGGFVRYFASGAPAHVFYDRTNPAWYRTVVRPPRARWRRSFLTPRAPARHSRMTSCVTWTALPPLTTRRDW